MARKNLLTDLISPKLPDGNSDGGSVGLAPSFLSGRSSATGVVSQGAIGAVSRSIAELKQQVTDAQRVQEQLAAGLAVVELIADDIDSSFVADRLEVPVSEQLALSESIREHGQQVPILVRPNPGVPGRFQVAYGHRRLNALKHLGFKVRAVVREMSNDELVVAQGLENSARKNLSFLERALYAATLEEQGFNRDVIMSALAIDKTALSKLISVPAKLPRNVLIAIGAAPKIGRDRWLQLVEVVSNRRTTVLIDDLVATPRFQSAQSDERFELVIATVSKKSPDRKTVRPSIWRSEDGKKLGQISQDEKRLIFSIEKTALPGFAEFIRDELPLLLNKFNRQRQDEN